MSSANFPGVTRIMAQDTRVVHLALLPHRLDCVAALAPGILTYAAGAQEDSISPSTKASS